MSDHDYDLDEDNLDYAHTIAEPVGHMIFTDDNGGQWTGGGVGREWPEPVDTDIRCPHHTPAGQCLDHQGHLGDHQPPQEPDHA